jgi:hypothetical protein
VVNCRSDTWKSSWRFVIVERKGRGGGGGGGGGGDGGGGVFGVEVGVGIEKRH